MTKKERFEKILRQVEVKFNRGSANEWKNRDFEKLSLGILLKTKTNISVLTLKRIFGKISTPDDYFPQKATIEALEVYAGQFVLLNDIEAGAKAEPSKLTKSTNKKAFVFLIAGGALVLSVFILIIINAEPEIERKPSIQLTYTDGFNPKTVHFEYTTPNNTDSFSILFDDAYPPIYAQNGEKQTLSYYFQNPGLFRVRMMKNYSTISSTINVFVGTNKIGRASCRERV